jgi:L-aspartate oxidase
MKRKGLENVWLDARPPRIKDFAKEFPTVFDSCMAAGIDPRVQAIPVAPAEHYSCGGVLTDLNGATSIPGLWAVGEVADTGVQGANRLASNSLLEGIVYGEMLALAIDAGIKRVQATGMFADLLDSTGGLPDRFSDSVHESRYATLSPEQITNGAVRDTLQKMMFFNVGLERSEASLEAAFKELNAIRRAARSNGHQSITAFEAIELANLCVVSEAIIESAYMRRETRGCHTRSDFLDHQTSAVHYITDGSDRALFALPEQQRALAIS